MKLGPYLLGPNDTPENGIYTGDALQLMKKLPESSIDAVIVDPPYSSGTRREASKGLRKSMNRTMDDEDWFITDCLTTNGFVWLMRRAALEWHRVLVPGGHILTFVDWRMMPNLAGAIESADLRHIGLLVWDKTYFGMGEYFRNQHELVLHFTKGKSRPVYRHDVANVIACPPVRGGDHPTEKPLALMATLVSVVTDIGQIVLDCFIGSGTTAAACQAIGRRFVGFDRMTKWADFARERVRQTQPPLLVPQPEQASLFTQEVPLEMEVEQDA